METRPSTYLSNALEIKQRILEEHKGLIGKARKDHHSRRKPIPCGMTIHPAIGCSFGCLYCYVPDMGFPLKPQPYPLEPEEMLVALALNPYFLPGPAGTLVAFGSVTEPFMTHHIINKTLGYMRFIGGVMGNPLQVSTKAAPGEWVAEELSSLPNGPPSVLISVATYSMQRTLEPGAASVDDRLRWGQLLMKRGVPVTLFLRPIIPGVPLDDLSYLLEKAWSMGYRRVILGSLRVTMGILRRLKAAGLPYEVIAARLPRRPANPREQITLRMGDLKQTVAYTAVKTGFNILPASCSANVVDHGQSCWACNLGPCGNPKHLPKLDVDDVMRSAEILGLKCVKDVSPRNGEVTVLVNDRCGKISRKRRDVLETILTTLYRRRFLLRIS